MDGFCGSRTKTAPLLILAVNDNLPCTPDNSKFVCSPADMQTHSEVDIQDSQVDNDMGEQLDALCAEYSGIFSQHPDGMEHLTYKYGDRY